MKSGAATIVGVDHDEHGRKSGDQGGKSVMAVFGLFGGSLSWARYKAVEMEYSPGQGDARRAIEKRGRVPR
jgi:hypothetical protein